MQNISGQSNGRTESLSLFSVNILFATPPTSSQKPTYKIVLDSSVDPNHMTVHLLTHLHTVFPVVSTRKVVMRTVILVTRCYPEIIFAYHVLSIFLMPVLHNPLIPWITRSYLLFITIQTQPILDIQFHFKSMHIRSLHLSIGWTREQRQHDNCCHKTHHSDHLRK